MKTYISVAVCASFLLLLAGCQFSQFKSGLTKSSLFGKDDKADKTQLSSVGAEADESNKSTLFSSKKSGGSESSTAQVSDRSDKTSFSNRRSRFQSVAENLKAGNTAAEQDQLDEAKLNYQKVLEDQPNHEIAHHRLAIIADKQRDYHAAERHYLGALKSNQSNPDLLSDLGYSYFLQGRYRESEQSLRQALAAQPSHLRALNNLGLLYGTKGDYDQALAMFRRTGTEHEAQDKMARLFPQGKPADQVLMSESPRPQGSFNPPQGSFSTSQGAASTGQWPQQTSATGVNPFVGDPMANLRAEQARFAQPNSNPQTSGFPQSSNTAWHHQSQSTPTSHGQPDTYGQPNPAFPGMAPPAASRNAGQFANNLPGQNPTMGTTSQAPSPYGDSNVGQFGMAARSGVPANQSISPVAAVPGGQFQNRNQWNQLNANAATHDQGQMNRPVSASAFPQITPGHRSAAYAERFASHQTPSPAVNAAGTELARPSTRVWLHESTPAQRSTAGGQAQQQYPTAHNAAGGRPQQPYVDVTASPEEARRTAALMGMQAGPGTMFPMFNGNPGTTDQTALRTSSATSSSTYRPNTSSISRETLRGGSQLPARPTETPDFRARLQDYRREVGNPNPGTPSTQPTSQFGTGSASGYQTPANSQQFPQQQPQSQRYQYQQPEPQYRGSFSQPAQQFPSAQPAAQQFPSQPTFGRTSN